MARLLLALAALAAVALGAQAKCNMAPHSLYPPKDTALEWKTIDLDKHPMDRWTDAVKPLAAQIHKMVYQVIDLLPEEARNKVLANIDGNEDKILDAWPAPYGDEVRGIQKATGIDMAALILFQMGYELEGGCTSLVAENNAGQIFHARNLDFGLFMGWDKQNHTWTLAEDLRPLLFNAHFVKGGVNVYNSTVYAGFVGLLTGMKKGGFSITVDTRFDNTLYEGLIEWFKGNTSHHFLSFTTRQVMEEEADFDAAFARLNTTDMIGPSYIILGGAKPGQGAIITRAVGKTSLHPWTLQNDAHKTGFYVIETNYDNWVKAPFYDDRRDPAEECLAQIGQENIEFESLYNMLSAQPNLNLLTTYTTLMNVAEGRFEAYKQVCRAHPCTPW